VHLLVNIDVDVLDRAVRFHTAAFDLRVGRRFGAGGVELLADPFGHGFCLLQFVGNGYDEIADPA